MDLKDIMGMETGFLQYAMELLKKDYSKELQILKIQLPKVDQIPAVRFDKAKELVSEKYNRKIRNPYDLEPEEEALIGRYFKEEYNATPRITAPPINSLTVGTSRRKTNAKMIP